MSTQKPDKKHGLAHVLAAASYSAGGLARLWRETAFRHETVAFILILFGFAVIGAPVWGYVGAALLYLLTAALEAVNTAVEELVDHASPAYSDMAKAAKDLGSFAVFCLLVANGLWILFVFSATYFR